MPVRPSGSLSHLSQYLLFRVWVLGVQPSSLPLLSFLVCPPPFPTIGFGSLNSWFSWASPWVPSTSLTVPSPTVGGPAGEGWGLPRVSVLAPSTQTPDYWLGPCLPPRRTGLWCLATWPLGNSGLGGPPLTPTHTLTQGISVRGQGLLRAGTLLLLSVPSTGCGTNDC